MSIDHITDGLYIADIDSVQTEPTGQFDCVISVCQDHCRDNVGDNATYCHFPLADDRESQREWGGSYDYRLFRMAAQKVMYEIRGGYDDNVLVHCHRGKNRSVAVCAAALAAHDDETFESALSLIQRQRPIADPNELMRDHGRRFVAEWNNHPHGW